MRSQSRVSVIASFAAGWIFLVTKLHRLALRLVAPAALLFLLQVTGATPQGVLFSGTGTDLAVLVVFALHLFATVLVIAGAYRVALGDDHRFLLARLELGPDELRVLGAKFLIWAAVLLLFLGANVLSQQILALFETLGILSANTAKIPPTDFQWFKDIQTLKPFVELAPLALFSLLLAWFGLRYALVFAGIVAERHFGVFSYMSLTKGQTWRLALLWVLLWLSLVAALKLPLIALGWLAFDAGWFADGNFGRIAILLSTFDLGPPLQLIASAPEAATAAAGQTPIFNPAPAAPAPAPLPGWLAPLLTVAGNLIWQIVFAGALAHAYSGLAAGARSRLS